MSRAESKPGRRGALAVALCGLVAIVAAIALRGKAVRTDARAIATDPGPPPAQPEAPPLFKQRLVHQGLSVDFSIQQIDPSRRDAKELQEGDDVRIRFAIADTATGKAVRGANPAAWMDLIPKDEIRGAKTCEQKARAFLGGSIFGKAELNLNNYYVVTLNDEASLSIVDPLSGFGGTKLLGMTVLESPGEDWVITSDDSRIYVSMSQVHKVAVVDAAGWEVVKNIDVGRRPGRVALQPDDSHLWVLDEDERDDSGVNVIDTTSLKSVARITTGRGRHEVAFSDDGRWAFVTNDHDGNVSVIETRSSRKVGDLPTGPGPASVAFSPLAKMAYIATGDGTITVVDATRRTAVARIKAEPGLGQIRFAPGGRLGFVVNSARDEVHILDAGSNRIVQTADVEDEPYQLAFTDELAYVRHRGSEAVLMLPLKALGVEKRPVQVFSFPGGQIPPGKAPRLSPADSIVQAPGENAVLVANPMDKTVYYYVEGMAAPKGSFSNYGRQCRAVLVVDRSLKERRLPGVYETIARLRRPGEYDVVFFQDSPRIIHCFSASVAPNPVLETKRREGKIHVEHLDNRRNVKTKETVPLRFRLTDQKTEAPISGLADVEVLATLVPGTWHKRHFATAGKDGIYLLDFTPPRPGLYTVHLQCLSRGLSFANPQFLTLEATDPEEPPASGDDREGDSPP